jgi:hypothetical protein
LMLWGQRHFSNENESARISTRRVISGVSRYWSLKNCSEMIKERLHALVYIIIKVNINLYRAKLHKMCAKKCKNSTFYSIEPLSAFFKGSRKFFQLFFW